MPYQEETLVGHHLLAAWKAKDELPSAYIGARINILDAGFFKQLADGSFLERLATFEAAARGSPVALPRKGIFRVNEAK